MSKATTRDMKILEWGGSTRAISVFLDVSRNVTFSKTLKAVLIGFKENPARNWSASKEEHAKAIADCKSKTIEEAQAMLPDYLRIEAYGGKLSAKSKIYNTYTGVSREYSLKDLIISLNTGSTPGMKGAEVSSRHEVKEKKKATALRNGHIKLIDGKTIKELIEELGCSYSFAQSNLKKGAVEQLYSYNKFKSSLESVIANWLDSCGIPFVSNEVFESTSYRPDFVIPEHKLIIECDGLYWHSDAKQADSNYHVAKKAAYTQLGYNSVFFRENEINQKLPIVKSMLLARLGLAPEKYMARKLCVLPGSQDFMERHHLMGPGSGRRYSLFHESSEVAQMQVKWVDKSSRTLEISRFATNGSIVSGGFSKLLKHIEIKEQPKFVKTFIDLRYGEGKYLPSLGFTHSGTHKSFVWTKTNDLHHRMKFPGNTGYELGYNKLWDCGQAKYVKEVI